MRISRVSSDSFARSTLAFTPSTSGAYQVSFLNQGGDNIGALLDRVAVQSGDADVYAYSFTAADFGFSDPADAVGAVGANSLQSVILTSLPATGTLRLSGVAVSAGQEIATGSLASLTYTPPANANGSAIASFSFQVRDNASSANGGINLDPTVNTIRFDVTPVNDPGTIRFSSSSYDLKESLNVPLQTLKVDSRANVFPIGQPKVFSDVLVSGKSYRLEISGTWQPDPLISNWLVDARFVSRNNFATVADVDSVYGDFGLYSSTLDGGNDDFLGTYQASHIYSLEILGQGLPLD
jgi:hypothetical protein